MTTGKGEKPSGFDSEDTVLGLRLDSDYLRAALHQAEAVYFFIPNARELVGPLIEYLEMIVRFCGPDFVTICLQVKREARGDASAEAGSQAKSCDSVNADYRGGFFKPAPPEAPKWPFSP